MRHNTLSKLAVLAAWFSSLVFEIALPAQVASPEITSAPAVRTRVEPKYTGAAFQAGITGKAILFVKVDKNGVPTQVKFIRWSGRNGDKPFGLDQAAVKAVREWRFSPRVEWGKAEPFSASIEVEFDFHRHPEQLPQPADRAVRI